tara:strand:+ start:904 stop:1137 length:234 start_codon:yes stop_codon:yes gene_type:complete
MQKLTQIQFETLSFIKGFISIKGYPPSRQEIADEFDVAHNAAQQRVKALIQKGALEQKEGKQRSLIPVKGFRYRVDV